MCFCILAKMIFMKYLFIQLFLLTTILSCEKDYEKVDPEMWQIHQCQQNNNFTPDIIQTLLIGEWNWYQMICAETSIADMEFKKGLKVEFKDDSTFQIFNYGELLNSGDWEIKVSDKSIELLTIPKVYEFSGNFSMCPNKFLFNNTGLDGCANFFKRK